MAPSRLNQYLYILLGWKWAKNLFTRDFGNPACRIALRADFAALLDLNLSLKLLLILIMLPLRVVYLFELKGFLPLPLDGLFI